MLRHRKWITHKSKDPGKVTKLQNFDFVDMLLKQEMCYLYLQLNFLAFSVLVTIFETDIETTRWNRTLSPHVSDFLNYLWPKLEILYNIAPNSNGLSSK